MHATVVDLSTTTVNRASDYRDIKLPVLETIALVTATVGRGPILAKHTPPTYVSSDHDPLYRFHQWQRNLRILDVQEIKTVPYVPLSHPFIERLFGTVRRECLDRTLFWTAADLEMKLLDFQRYYNGHRTHAGLARHARSP